jgi:hypothetical protein
VDELELLLVHNLTGKGLPLELGHHTGVAQLLDVIDLRHPTHYLLTPELPERLEVEMPESFMSSPSFIVSTISEAEGSSHLHVKNVQPVAPVVDLGEKTTAAVPDPVHPSVNLHPRATFVELAKADDEVPEGRDVVDPMEQLVLASLGHEHNGPDAADLHRGLLVEFDEALDAVVQVGKVPDAFCHVVRGTTVDVPSLKLVVVRAVVEEGSRTRLVNVEQGRRGERRHGVGVRGSSSFTLALFSSGLQYWAGMGQEQCGLPILLSLGHVDRSPTPGLSAVPGPVAVTAAVVADVVVGRLAFPAATSSYFSTATTAGSAIGPAAARLVLPARLSMTVLG